MSDPLEQAYGRQWRKTQKMNILNIKDKYI